MKKTFKSLQIIVLVLAGLGIYNLMTTHGLNTMGRYQYRDFESGEIMRWFADSFLLVSLLTLLIRKWTEKSMGAIHIIVSVIYIGLIVNDIRIWLWLKDSNPGYYSALITYALSLIIIFRDLINLLRIGSIRLIIVSMLILILGFIFDILFVGIPYQDASYEIYDKVLFYTQIVRTIYYLGLIILTIGIINLITDKLIKRSLT